MKKKHIQVSVITLVLVFGILIPAGAEELPSWVKPWQDFAAIRMLDYLDHEGQQQLRRFAELLNSSTPVASTPAE